MANARQLVVVGGMPTKVGGSALEQRKSWRSLVANFIASLDVKESSRKLYTRTITQYFHWLYEQGKVIDQLTRLDILEYRDSLQRAGFSALTQGSYIIAVRKFYEWTEGEKIYPNIAKGIKTPSRKNDYVKQHLSDEKSKELLAHFQSLSLRDYAIVNLMLRTGLRTIEVVRADVGDITFRGEQRVLKIWGKGRAEKDDFVVLTDKSYQPIKTYLDSRKNVKAGDPLFTSNSRQNHGKRLTTRTISKICKEGLQAIGMDGKEFTAHSLRHTAACAMLKHGADLMAVQYSMRHANPATTEIYLKSLDKEDKIKNSFPLLDEAF